jgi:hypothetical protein
MLCLRGYIVVISHVLATVVNAPPVAGYRRPPLRRFASSLVWWYEAGLFKVASTAAQTDTQQSAKTRMYLTIHVEAVLLEPKSLHGLVIDQSYVTGTGIFLLWSCNPILIQS